MDFFNEKELVTQTGHDVGEWPLVVVKELVDNALDACEEADSPPVIDVVADASGIAVGDNGPGLPEATLRGAMDFTARVSNREAYVSPCRGAQGNALKTLLPMPRVLDPGHGRLIVTARGRRHEVRCGADPISQRAAVTDDVTDAHSSEAGTTVRLQWSPHRDHDGSVRWPFQGLPAGWFAGPLRSLVEGFALFNPHATFRLVWFGQASDWTATDASWRKWKPHRPTSSHWYEQAHLERLLGAYLTHDREAGEERLVSDFLAEFDGLSGSAKRTKVLGQAGLKRSKLTDLVAGDRLDAACVAALLAAMRKHSTPVKPDRLGTIGEAHLKARLLGMGVQPESFTYAKKQAKDGLPWVLESAFGWLGPEAEGGRKICTGANWSAAIKNPYRSFGGTGEGLETALAQLRVTRNEPVVFVLHLAHPRLEYTDRGKSALVIGG
jgi:DNA topoisomerase VI subunit B